jgi:hypothetical protein
MLLKGESSTEMQFKFGSLTPRNLKRESTSNNVHNDIHFGFTCFFSKYLEAILMSSN